MHHAITATAFASLSVRPPLVLLALDRDSQLLDLVRRSGHVGLSVLSDDQEEIGRRTAARGRRIDGVVLEAPTTTALTGAPLILGALAWFDCEVQSIAEHGDHVIIVGRVVATAAADGEPLVYFRRAYRTLGGAIGLPDASR